MCYTNLRISHCFDEDPFEGKKHDTMGIFFMNMDLQTKIVLYSSMLHCVLLHTKCIPLLQQK